MSNIQSLLDKRAGIYGQMQDLYNRAKKEDRSLSTDEQEQFDRMDTEYKSLSEQIKDAEKAKSIADRFEQIGQEQKSVFGGSQSSDKEPKPGESKKPEYKNVLDKWMRRGIRGLNNSEETILYEKRGTSTNVVGTDALGGYTVPDEWQQELVKTMVEYGGMLSVSRMISTGHGRKIYVPTVPYAGGGESATQKGHLIGEDTGDTVTDVRFLEKELDAYVYSSYGIQLSWELMQDSMFDVAGLVLEIGADRVGRIVNEHLTTGTGSSQPNGVVTASTLGKTAAAVAAITADELVDLEHSVDPAYRRGSSVRFMFNDSTLGAIKKLSFGSSDDRPLWVPSIREGEPDRLLGYQYTINQDMASLATANKTVLFGDFSKYWVRQAGFAEIARSDERYIENRKSVFYVFGRYDGELVDANAIKHLIQA